MVLLIQVGHEEQKIFYKKLSWLKDLKSPKVFNNVP